MDAVPPSRDLLGVGILGAGPVTQAIHLPTLARLTDTFRVVQVMDVSAETAQSVAARVGALWTTSMDEVLADPAVDVVVICSPPQFHARQVIAACHARKRAILCEKPFAVTAEEAAEIADASIMSGVPILVGAMHAYDSAWSAIVEHASEVLSDAHTINSSIVLPPNARFEDFATEVEGRLPSPGSAPFDEGSEVAIATVEGGIMGLAIHDLPLVREVLERRWGWTDLEVLTARPLWPFGYHIVFRATGIVVELHAVMSSNWEPDWRLTVTGDDAAVEVQFAPSYVHAGSGEAAIFRSGSSVRYEPSDYNGYESEWRHLRDVARGADPLFDTKSLIDDLRFALTLRDRATAWMRSPARTADAAGRAL